MTKPEPLKALVDLLPATWQPRAKAIAAALLSALLVLSTSLVVVPMWVTVGLGILTVGGVYQTPAPGYVAPSDAVPAE